MFPSGVRLFAVESKDSLSRWQGGIRPVRVPDHQNNIGSKLHSLFQISTSAAVPRVCTERALTGSISSRARVTLGTQEQPAIKVSGLQLSQTLARL